MNELLIICGPCVIEDDKIPFQIADRLDEIISAVGLSGYFFKASYKKANRTRLDSFIGINESDALEILNGVRELHPLIYNNITDIHESVDAEMVAKYQNILQIPAFLCRQTELILAAAKHSPIVNIKKGQWMHPEQMKYAVEKANSVINCQQVWVTERGTAFGYSHNIVDMTGIPIMKQFADKVIVDCTHSVQTPNSGDVTGGNPEMIETIALAAVAAGADGLFFEVHPNPKKSLSDAGSILDIEKFQAILEKCIKVKQAIS